MLVAMAKFDMVAATHNSSSRGKLTPSFDLYRHSHACGTHTSV